MKLFALAITSCLLFLQPLQANNPIPPRLQWNANDGYCGEVSLISAGLYYGQYISQYDARAIAIKDKPQNKGELLLGVNDAYAAAQMHLDAVEWNTANEQNTKQFLAWVKQNVLQGYPVAIGIFTNEYLFYNNPNPNAGDNVYDHIVPVIGIQSSSGCDTIIFSDNGLWGNAKNTPYIFSYSFETFPANRQQANAKNGPIYSLYDGGENYGIAILGVKDKHRDTLPVRVNTNVNFEKPAIKNKSSQRPTPMPLELTITVSGLQPGVHYNLYKYNTMQSVPEEQFNAHASHACEHWPIEIATGSTFAIQQTIQSDEVAVFRAVKASAP